MGPSTRKNHIRNRTIRYSGGIDSGCPPAGEEQRDQNDKGIKDKAEWKKKMKSMWKRLGSITTSRKQCVASPAMS